MGYAAIFATKNFRSRSQLVSGRFDPARCTAKAARSSGPKRSGASCVIEFAIADDHTADCRFAQETVELNMSSKALSAGSQSKISSQCKRPASIAGDEAIGRESDERNDGRVEFEAKPAISAPGHHIPQSDRVVPPSRRRAARPAAGRGPGPHSYAPRGGRSRSRRHIPQSDCVVIGAGGEPPVRQQAKGQRPIHMSLRGGPSRRRWPHPTIGSFWHRSPRRAARPAAGKGPNLIRMPFEAGGLGLGRHIPQPDRFVIRARGEPPVRQQAKG